METLNFLMISTHFPPYHLGGDAQFVDYLTRELVKRGHESHVFFNPAAFEMLRGRKDANSQKTGNDPTVHKYSSSTGRIDPFVALSFGLWGRPKRKLEDLVKSLKPDIVHWHNTRGFIGRPYPFPGKVSLYTTHDYTPVCPRSNLLKPGMRLCVDPKWCTVCCMKWGKPPQLWRFGTRRILKYSDGLRIVSPSEFVAKRFESEGIHVHKVLRGFVPDFGKEFADREPRGDHIFYLGLLERHKGVETLLEAFAKSAGQQQFKLYVVGEGTLRTKLTRRVSELGLESRVALPGFLSRDKVEELRTDAAAQVVPSVWFENAPSVVLEAFSHGIPVIASRIGGLPEIVTPQSGSKTFTACDVGELSEAIVSAWEERGDLAKKRKMARGVYVAEFTPDRHVTEYLKMVSELSTA